MFNALEESPAGNDMDFVAKLHLVEKHIRSHNLKLTFADRLGLAEDDKGEVSSQARVLARAAGRETEPEHSLMTWSTAWSAISLR